MKHGHVQEDLLEARRVGTNSSARGRTSLCARIRNSKRSNFHPFIHGKTYRGTLRNNQNRRAREYDRLIRGAVLSSLSTL